MSKHSTSRHFSTNPDVEPDIVYGNHARRRDASGAEDTSSSDETIVYTDGYDDADPLGDTGSLGRRRHMGQTSAASHSAAEGRRSASRADGAPVQDQIGVIGASDKGAADDFSDEASYDGEDAENVYAELAVGKFKISRKVAIALAALIVLLLVLIPALVMRREEKKLEASLDARAQVVFEIVQKRLSALAKEDKATQKADATNTQQATNSTPAKLASFQQVVKNYRIVEAPSDYPGTWSEDVFLVSLGKGDKPMTSYLFDGTSDIIKSGLGEGEWVVELNPETAEVYSAFWWDEDEEGTEKDLTYEKLKDLRKRGRLTKSGVGYFNRTDMAERASEAKPTLPTVTMQVENREELYVSLVSEGFKELLQAGKEKDVLEKIEVNVTVMSTADEERYFTLKVTGDEFAGVDSELGELDVVLDSMRTDKEWHFAELSADKDGNMTVIPGEDVSVSVRVSCEGYEEAEATATDADGNTIREIAVNSLFANGTILDSEIQISCLRHLNNLRNEWCADGDEAQAAQFSTVKLAKDIDFDGTRCADAELDAIELPEGATGWLARDVSLDSRAKADEDLEKAILEGTKPSDALPNYNPLSTFDPIAAYAGYVNNSQHVFDGGGFVLKNFRIGEHTDEVTTVNPDEAGWLEGGTDDTGLFASAAFQLRGVRLEDFIVNGGNNTGALVGTVLAGDDRVMLEDCYLYGESLVHGNRMVGGLVGKTEGRGSLRDCHVGITPEATTTEQLPAIVAAGDSCGGVVGNFAGGVIGLGRDDGTTDISVLANLRSGTDENGHACLGGVVGAVMGESDSSISSVDVGDMGHTLDIHANGASVGGVAGYFVGSEIRDCLVTANIEAGSASDGESYAGGIAGRTEDGNVSFIECRFGNEDAKTIIKGSGGCVGGIAGRVAASGACSDLEVFADVEAGSGEQGRSHAGGIAGSVASGSSQWIRMLAGSQNTRIVVKGSGSCVGGAFGDVAGDGELSDCAAYATVEAGSGNDGTSHAGGLVGSKSGGSISNCTVGDSNGNVRMSVTGSGSRVGGLIGSLDKAVIKGCSIYANVSGGSATGGVVGSSSKGTFQDMSTAGNVDSSGSFVGGFVGESEASTYSSCFVGDINHEGREVYKVSGNSQGVGGFVGRSGGDEKYDSCVVVGTNIKGGEASEGVGGIGGFVDAGTVISNCSVQGYSSTDAQITGGTHVGAFCGAVDKGVVDEKTCVAIVSINGKHWGEDDEEEIEEDEDDDIPDYSDDAKEEESDPEGESTGEEGESTGEEGEGIVEDSEGTENADEKDTDDADVTVLGTEEAA